MVNNGTYVQQHCKFSKCAKFDDSYLKKMNAKNA